VSLVERARVLAAQTGTTGAPNRATIAVEARQLHARLITLSGASAEGRYVFGGDGSTNPPFDADATSPTGAALVSGATTNSILISDERNTTFSVFRTASEVFDAPGTANVFKAFEDLTKALVNDSESEVQAALPAIVNALNHLNQQLAFYGNAQNRVASALASAKKNTVALHKDLSQLQETDLPAAILELNSAKVHHEAALMSQSKIPRSTLFDYLG
jgi:flagellar hook-associated protein 3 FlgL